MRWAALFGLAVTSVFPAGAAEDPDEWVGQSVLTKMPDVCLRETPDREAPPVGGSLDGFWYEVRQAQGEWLKVANGWVRTDQVVRAGRAVDFFTSEIARDPSAFAHVGRCRARAKANDIGGAMADAEKAIQLDSGSARAYFARGRVWEDRGDGEKACADFAHSIELDPEGAMLYLARARILYGRRDFEKAIADCNAAIRVHPTLATAHQARAACRFLRHEYEDAVADLREAQRLDGAAGYEAAVRRTCRCQGVPCTCQPEEYDKPIRGADDGLGLDPEDAHAYAGRAKTWTKRGEFDKAVEDYNAAILLDPFQPRSYTGRGNALAKKGEFGKAIEDYNAAIHLDPCHAGTYARRGVAWVEKGELDKAIDDFSSAIRIAPSSPLSFIGRGACWAAKEEYDRAIDDFSEGARLDSSAAAAWLGRAGARFAKGQYAGTLGDLEQALRWAGEDLRPAVQGAMAWSLAVCPDAAFRDGKRALALATECVAVAGDGLELDAIETLAAAHAECGDFTGAVKWQSKALEMIPDDDNALREEQQARLDLYTARKPYRAPPKQTETPSR